MLIAAVIGIPLMLVGGVEIALAASLFWVLTADRARRERLHGCPRARSDARFVQ
jgi:hypothetical protein